MTNKTSSLFKRTTIILPLVLLSLALIFTISVKDVSATPTNTIYVNGSSGNNDWNGLTSKHTSGLNGPKATIKNATGTVTSNGKIQIASGTYNESHIQINTNMTIIGENQKNTVINGQKSGNSIFTIISGVNVTIINLTLTNGTSTTGGAIYNHGTLKITNSTFTDNTADVGGAIHNFSGTLTVTNSTLKNNTVTNQGGAIYNALGTSTITNSTFNNNIANNIGGAIYNALGTSTITNSTFNNNTATNQGGAIYRQDELDNTLTITNTTFYNNTSANGGAISDNSQLIITNTTFINNTATEGNGGAIFHNNGNLTVTNSTLTGNTAKVSGGAIYCVNLTLTNSTLRSNSADDLGGAIYAGTLTIAYSKIESNKADKGGAIYIQNGDTTAITHTTINSNTANSDGGAIYNGDNLKITYCTLYNNIAKNDGGAIYNTGDAVTITNTTIKDNKADNGGGIYTTHTLIINNTTITDNTANNNGGAIYNTGDAVTITNTTFTNNTANNDGGAIYNTGDNLRITNSTFTGNKADKGGALYNTEWAVTITNSAFINSTANNDGGAIYNTGDNLRITNSTFTNNTANNDGGAIYNGDNVFDGVLIINNCTLTDNIAKNGNGGVLYDGHGSSVVHFNRIVGNSPNNSQIYIDKNKMDATLNWWGSNRNPSSYVSNGTNGSVDVSSWLVLTITADPTSIFKGSNSTVTADLLHDNNGKYQNPVNGHVPDGNTVKFASDALGTVTHVTNSMRNGSANTTFIGNFIGVSSISAMVDNQIVTTTVTIKTPEKTILTVKNVTGVNNRKVALNATLTDNYGHLLAGQTIFFNINGHKYDAVTGNNGVATLNYIPNGAGNYKVMVNYHGNNKYAASESNSLLTVNPSSYLYLQIKSYTKNPKIGETFTVTYKLGNKGPNNAINTIITIPLPANFKISNITGDGKWKYSSIDNTVTWTLTKVTVGDPYLYITGKINTSGVYVFGSNVTSETFNLNTKGVAPITINAIKPVNPSKPTSNSSETLNASKIPMKHTGVPVNGLILAILTVIGGSLIPRLKK